MTHPLDRPAWTALNSIHAAFAQGSAAARRYEPSIAPFAATVDDNPESLAQLASLVAPGEGAVFLQAEPIVLPPSLKVSMRAMAVQMLAMTAFESFEDQRIQPLTLADTGDMHALAVLTKPGPFTARALDIGCFWGVRQHGQLVAMAGQRMAQTGYVEVSGVCSHPDARGQGYAKLLSRFVAGQISAAGQTPYLHAYATNAAAIGLYAEIGFVARCAMHVAMAQAVA